MRLFVAMPLANECVQQLRLYTARLRLHKDTLRWTAPESWHITLQFLGDTKPERYSQLVDALRSIYAKSVSVQVEGLGCFERPGVFWVGVQPSSKLSELQKKVSTVTEICAFAGDNRPYRPHITLARGRNLQNIKQHLDRPPAFISFVADEFLLYESFLGRDGARYEVRERFKLHT